jgi:hypothetical protein
VALCTELDTARAASRAGSTVVLVGADGDGLGRAAATLRSEAPGSQVGVLVGDPDDGAVWAAARALAAELYGEDGCRVTTVAEAEELASRTVPTSAGTAVGPAFGTDVGTPVGAQSAAPG